MTPESPTGEQESACCVPLAEVAAPSDSACFVMA